MKNKNLTIALCDDQSLILETILFGIQACLSDREIQFIVSNQVEEMLEKVSVFGIQEIDIIISDFNLGHDRLNGIDFFNLLTELGYQKTFILFTADYEVDYEQFQNYSNFHFVLKGNGFEVINNILQKYHNTSSDTSF